jgi:hypothetical protein
MIVVLVYHPTEDDAAAHGEERNVFDGISVFGVFDDEVSANEAVAKDQARLGFDFKYMIDEPGTAHRHNIG